MIVCYIVCMAYEKFNMVPLDQVDFMDVAAVHASVERAYSAEVPLVIRGVSRSLLMRRDLLPVLDSGQIALGESGDPVIFNTQRHQSDGQLHLDSQPHTSSHQINVYRPVLGSVRMHLFMLLPGLPPDRVQRLKPSEDVAQKMHRRFLHGYIDSTYYVPTCYTAVLDPESVLPFADSTFGHQARSLVKPRIAHAYIHQARSRQIDVTDIPSTTKTAPYDMSILNVL
jgi:hypothetical protein